MILEVRSDKVIHYILGSILLAVVLAIVAWPIVQDTEIVRVFGPFFKLTCHQLPERCLSVGDDPMPVCARCTGVWVGQLACALFAIVASESRWIGRRKLALGMLAVAACAWSAGHQFGFDWPVERLITGAIGGLGIYVLSVGELHGVARNLKRISPW